jgi:hypothetical protein
MSAPRMVSLCKVWERTSAKGTRYFSGFLGSAQLLIFEDGQKPHPTRPGEVVTVWNVLLQELDLSRHQRGGQ